MSDATTAIGIPPLEDGQLLDRAEFHRRYEAMPHIKKAELIEGVVYMPSPVSLENHGEQHSYLAAWMVHYQGFTPGTRSGDNATVLLDDDNEPQPDCLLMIRPECGGQARVVNRYVGGGPELVAEVSFSSLALDLGPRFRAYQARGICEYIVWRVEPAAIFWFVLREGAYVPLQPGADGIYRSEVYPGLWLDADALLRLDFPAILSVLQQGLASPEHQAFVASLQARRTP